MKWATGSVVFNFHSSSHYTMSDFISSFLHYSLTDPPPQLNPSLSIHLHVNSISVYSINDCAYLTKLEPLASTSTFFSISQCSHTYIN